MLGVPRRACVASVTGHYTTTISARTLAAAACTAPWSAVRFPYRSTLPRTGLMAEPAAVIRRRLELHASSPERQQGQVGALHVYAAQHLPIFSYHQLTHFSCILCAQEPPRDVPQLPPPEAVARALAAAASAGRQGAALTTADAALIALAWARLLPRTVGECNRLLSARLRSALTGEDDTESYDLLKEDGRAFMAGRIGVDEFADRFDGILARAPQQLRDELLVQTALLLPSAEKRLELLRFVNDVRSGTPCRCVAALLLLLPSLPHMDANMLPPTNVLHHWLQGQTG
jgi:hypothetical protein